MRGKSKRSLTVGVIVVGLVALMIFLWEFRVYGLFSGH